MDAADASEADSYEQEEIRNDDQDAVDEHDVNADDDDDEDDEDAKSKAEEEDPYLAQLGYLEAKASMPLTSRFFPSKVGGLPVRVNHNLFCLVPSLTRLSRW